MKKGFFIFIQLFFLLIAASASAQLNVWRPQNPPTIAGGLKAIQMISQYTSYIVGESTSFIMLSDSGKKWNIKPGIAPDQFKRKTTLNALSFIDSTTGMTVGPNLVLKTTNAGTTWTNVVIPGPTKFTGVLMLSKKIAIVIGQSNLLVRTIDSGKTWSPYPMEFGVNLTSIRKVREDFIVITASNGYLFFSSDSGATWIKKLTSYGNDVRGIAFEDETKAVAVGELAFVATTSDSGNTWIRHAWDTMGFIVTNGINAVDTKAPGQYVAVGNYGTLVYSSDGGWHWKKGELDIFLNSGLNFNSVWMWNKDYGFAAGDLGFVVRTTDAGATWDFIPQDPMFSRMYSIAFPKGDSSHGIAVGTRGSVMTTSDGGKKWNIITSKLFSEKSDFYDVKFSDSKTAFACGDFGKLFRTTNYGATWDSVSIPVTRIMKHISFVDKDFGWISGDRNTLIETKNGGANWYIVFNGGPLNDKRDTITCVSFCDRVNGIVGGSKTTDGGFSWEYIGFNPQLQCHMISPTHYILTKYVDGGIGMMGIVETHIGDSVYSFGSNSVTLTVLFHDIEFGDSLRGTIVATGGTIYQTSDGGRTWELEDSRTSLELWGVTMPLSYVTSVTGIRGSIYRRTNTKPVEAVPHQSASTNSSFEIVSAYPNPTRDASKVVLRLFRAMPLEAHLFDELGAEVLSFDLGMLSEGEFEAPLTFAGLASGTYILEVRSSEQAKHIQIKLVK